MKKSVYNSEFHSKINKEFIKYNNNILKNNLFLSNLLTLTKDEALQEHSLMIMEFLLKNKSNLSYQNIISIQDIKETSDNQYKLLFSIENPFYLLSKLNLDFKLIDKSYEAENKIIEVIFNILKENNITFSNNNIIKEITLNPEKSFDLNLILKNSEINSKKDFHSILNFSNNEFIFFKVLDILKEEINENDFKNFIYDNNLISFLIKNDKVDLSINLIKKYNLDINEEIRIKNKDGCDNNIINVNSLLLKPICLTKTYKDLKKIIDSFPEIDLTFEYNGNNIFTHYSRHEEKHDIFNLFNNHIEKTTNTNKLENLNKQFLLLVSNKATKKDLQKFIKNNKLDSISLSSIKNKENDTLPIIFFKKKSYANLELCENLTNFYEPNFNNLNFFENCLILNNSHLNSSDKEKLFNFFYKIFSKNELNYDWSFNIINHIFKETDIKSIEYSNRGILSNNIFFNSSDQSNKFLNLFFSKIGKNNIEQENLKTSFKNNYYHDYEFNLEKYQKTLEVHFNFLIDVFLENNKNHNKNFNDFELNSIFSTNILNKRFFSDKHMIYLNTLSKRYAELNENKNLFFEDFFNKISNIYINDLNDFLKYEYQYIKETYFQKDNLMYKNFDIEEYSKMHIWQNYLENNQNIYISLINNLPKSKAKFLAETLQYFDYNKEFKSTIDYFLLNLSLKDSNNSNIQIKKQKI